MDLSGWFAGPCFVSVRVYHLLSLAIPTRQIDEHLQKWQPPKKTNSTILVFDLAKIFPRNCCNRYDLYRGLSFGGKNYCLGASRRFTSIRTLSDDECHKFRAIINTTCSQVWRISKEKAFKIFWQLLNFHVSTLPLTKIFDKKYFKRYISYFHILNCKATAQKLCTYAVLSNVIPYLLNLIGF